MGKVTVDAQPCRGYHHGDLRRCLLEAASDLLVEKGITGFSMREVARRAGVSPRAPYHHFRDRITLLAEVAREGFCELERRMEGPMEVADPAERLRRLGLSYLQFAADNPAAFETMHCDELCEPDNFPDRPTVAEGPFRCVRETIQSAVDEEIAERDLERFGLMAWATVYGLASLRAEGVLASALPDENLDEVLEDVVGRVSEMLIERLQRR